MTGDSIRVFRWRAKARFAKAYRASARTELTTFTLYVGVLLFEYAVILALAEYAQ